MYSTDNMVKSTNETAPSPIFPPERVREIDIALNEWFLNHQRDLKFRKTKDPYAIMVSEFMLQQTTVAAVEPYYARFLQRFPTVGVLAKASEDEVMAYWAGLGYYRRARQLRLAAQMITSSYQGEFPTDLKALQELPGFGRYTAGALLSAAFDLPVPILEANTVRVFARLAGYDGVVGESKFMNRLWNVSEILVNGASSPRSFNVAAMELGALVCRPVPVCSTCPVQEYCLAHRSGNPERTPRMKPRPEKVNVTTLCIVAKNADGAYLLRRIPKGEWHAGMWEFPTWRINTPAPTSDDANQLVTDELGGILSPPESYATFRHTVTHHSITAHVFRCYIKVISEHLAQLSGEYRLFFPAAFSDLAMGSTQRKIFIRISQSESQDNKQ